MMRQATVAWHMDLMLYVFVENCIVQNIVWNEGWVTLHKVIELLGGIKHSLVVVLFLVFYRLCVNRYSIRMGSILWFADLVSLAPLYAE